MGPPAKPEKRVAAPAGLDEEEVRRGMGAVTT